MIYVVLASILLFEATVAVCLLQALANWFRPWVRWLLWFGLLIVSLLLLAWALSAIDQAIVRNSATWPRGRTEFSLRAPFQSCRLLLVASATGPAVFLLVIATASLLRVRNGGLRLLLWTASLRSSAVCLLISSQVLLIALVVNDGWIRRRIREFDAESRELGEAARPTPCDNAENGAAVLSPIESLSQTLNRGGLPDPRENLARLKSSEWTEYLKRNAPTAQLVREAASRGCWLVDTDSLQPDMAAQYPEAFVLFDCTKLLLYEGHLALFDGETGLALLNAVALRRIAEQLIRDPRHILHSVAIDADRAASLLIEHLLYVHRPSAEEVSRLVQPAFEFRKSVGDYCVWQQAEHYRALPKHYFGLLATPEDRRLPGFSVLHAILLAKDRLLYAPDDLNELPKMFAKVRREARLSYPDLLANHNGVKYFYFDPLGGATITCLATGVYTPIAMHSLADMRRRLSDFALVLSQRGLIDEIMREEPEVAVPNADRPIDIFDGKPVRIIRADAGVVIYSIELYGDDDGGSEGIAASAGKGYRRDMTFCFGQAFQKRRLEPKKDDEMAAGVD